MKAVRLILDGHPETALKLLASHYDVKVPRVKVGTVKGYRKALGCYVRGEECIYVAKRELLRDPFVVLHEFYHHLRGSRMLGKRQVDKEADRFAMDFLRDLRDVSV